MSKVRLSISYELWYKTQYKNCIYETFFILSYQNNFSHCHFLDYAYLFCLRPLRFKYCKKKINVYTRKTFFQFAYNFDLCKRRQNCLHDLQTRIAWISSVWDVFCRLLIRCRHIYFYVFHWRKMHMSGMVLFDIAKLVNDITQ